MFGGGFFGGMGGDPFGGGGPGGSPKTPPNTTELYEVLGVPKDADASTIRKAYRKKAMKEHPDKGGDPEKFKAAQNAYSILSDEKKRAAYDKGGLEGVEAQAQGGGVDADDIASMFFGGGRRQRGPAKTRDVVRAFPVSLEDMYNGKTKRFRITRNVICTTCSGSGCKSGKAEKVCDGCDGRGIRVIVRRMGPMIQQMQVECPDCNGQGKSISDGDKCKKCRGQKVASETKEVEVHVEKGMKHGKKITLRGHADEAPDKEAGDLVFVLQQKKHALFTRKGTDLIMKKSITLLEALTGVTFELEHLDKQKYMITSAPGEVISSNAVKAVDDLGMPFAGNPFTKGKLFIEFNIEFPADGSLSPSDVATLASVLPGPSSVPELTEDHEEVVAKTVNLEEEARRSQERAREAYESDDDEGQGGAQQVRCAQQ